MEIEQAGFGTQQLVSAEILNELIPGINEFVDQSLTVTQSDIRYNKDRKGPGGNTFIYLTQAKKDKAGGGVM